MSELRITFMGLGLIANRPKGATVLMPNANHTAHLVGPFGNIALAPGSDLTLADSSGTTLNSGPTLRAGSEFVVHVDHIYGRSTPCPVDMLTGVVPPNVNVRVSLTGGMFAGVPASAYRGLLRDVLWNFDPIGERAGLHTQKMTDTVVFTASLPAGDYAVVAQQPDGSAQRHAFTLGASPTDITIVNDDDCPPLQMPDYTPDEAVTVLSLTGVAPGEYPKIQGVKSTGVFPLPEIKIPGAPHGCACDPICPIFQIDSAI